MKDQIKLFQEIENELRDMYKNVPEDKQEEVLKGTEFWKELQRRAKRRVRLLYSAVFCLIGIILTAAMEEWFFCIVCGLTSVYFTWLFHKTKKLLDSN